MALLDVELNSKIELLKSQAASAWKENSIIGFLSLGESAWELFPDPKNTWNEGYNFAKFMFKGLMLKDELAGAKLWLFRMVENNDTLHHFDGDCEFNEGKFFFAKGELINALEKFSAVVKDAGFRYFENEDPKYLAFYRDPEQFISSADS